MPDGQEALILLTVEELAVNELRESYHHWVRTVLLPVHDGQLGDPLPHRPARQLRGGEAISDPARVEQARDLLEDVEPELRNVIRNLASRLTKQLSEQLQTDGEEAHKREDERYRSRQGEVSALITQSTMAKLERDLAKLHREREQGLLGFAAERLDELERSIEQKQEELERRTSHYEDVRRQLERERERIIKYVLPKRYAMTGEAQVFPVCLEIRLAGESS